MKDNALIEPQATLVIGAAGGVGTAVVAKLITDGHSVISLDLHAGNHPATSRYFHYTADATNETELARVIAEITKTHKLKHVIVCSGGALKEEAQVKDLTELEMEVFERSLNHNLTSCFLIAKHTLPALRENKGAITFTGSINAHRGIGIYGYSAAKAGLEQFVRNLAAAEGRAGVRVNAVALGTVITPRTQELYKGDPNHFDSLNATTATGSTVSPTEAAVVLCNLTILFAGMTGQTLVLDAGQTIRW